MLRVVTVENGKIQGLPAADPRITSFKGIPFAAPPTGENRWRAPQPAINWDEVRNTFEFAPISLQSTPGNFHSIDLWFFFETLAKCWRPFVGKHYDLARQMCNYLANFISTGNPNGCHSTGEAMSQWEPYAQQAPYGMYFGVKAENVGEQPSDIMKFLVNENCRRRMHEQIST